MDALSLSHVGLSMAAGSLTTLTREASTNPKSWVGASPLRH